MQSIIRQFAKELAPAPQKQTGSTTYGTVRSVSGDTAMVVFDGAASATPCSIAMCASAGDRVVVNVGGGSAVVSGNVTRPADITDAKSVGKVLMQGDNTNIREVDGKLVISSTGGGDGGDDPVYVQLIPGAGVQVGAYEAAGVGPNILLRSTDNSIEVRDGTTVLADIAGDGMTLRGEDGDIITGFTTSGFRNFIKAPTWSTVSDATGGNTTFTLSAGKRKTVYISKRFFANLGYDNTWYPVIPTALYTNKPGVIVSGWNLQPGRMDYAAPAWGWHTSAAEDAATYSSEALVRVYIDNLTANKVSGIKLYAQLGFLHRDPGVADESADDGGSNDSAV